MKSFYKDWKKLCKRVLKDKNIRLVRLAYKVTQQEFPLKYNEKIILKDEPK